MFLKKIKILLVMLVILLSIIFFKETYAQNTVLYLNDTDLYRDEETIFIESGLNNNLKEESFLWGTANVFFNPILGKLTIGSGIVTEKDMFVIRINAYYEQAEIYEIAIQGELTLIGNASYVFSGFTECHTIEGLDKINVSGVNKMDEMFRNLYSLDQGVFDISTFDTSNVTSMNAMFENMATKTSGIDIILSTTKNNKLTSINSMFRSVKFKQDASFMKNFDTSNVMNMDYLFDSASGIDELDLSACSIVNVSSMKNFVGNTTLNSLNMPKGSNNLTSTEALFSSLGANELILEGFDTSKVENMSAMFQYASIDTIDVSLLDTSNVINMSSMFGDLGDVSEIKFGADFNTSNVEDMSNMFTGLPFKNLDISFLSTDSVIDMSDMFSLVELESINLEGMNTSNVKDMSNMFYGAKCLKQLDVHSFNTSNVVNMEGMFRATSSLTELDVASLDTSNVINMKKMFAGYEGKDPRPVDMNIKKLDLSNFKTENVTSMEGMFYYNSKLEELDLSSFYIAESIDTKDMFSELNHLETITLGKFIDHLHENMGLSDLTEDATAPDSWISRDSDHFYQDSSEFLKGYMYKRTDDKPEILFRSFKYNVQYYEGTSMRFEESYFFNDELEIKELVIGRFFVDKWTNQDNNTYFLSGEKTSNVGVTKNKESYNKTVTLLADKTKEREASLDVTWNSSNAEKLKSTIDISENNLIERIDSQFNLKIDDSVTDKEKILDYVVEVVSYETGKNPEVIDTMYKRVPLNEVQETTLDIDVSTLEVGKHKVIVNFYQLSVEGECPEEKEKIKESPSGSLELDLERITSFQIKEFPEVIRWHYNKSDSKGLLKRSSPNDMKVSILNSAQTKENWGLKMIITGPSDLPFKFMWKDSETQIGTNVELSSPYTIMTYDESGTSNEYIYERIWNDSSGLFVNSSEELKATNYESIKISWILNFSPDFS